MAHLSVPTLSSTSQQPLLKSDLLRWLYVGRMTLASGIMAGGLYFGIRGGPEGDTILIFVMFLVTLGVTGASYWHTHVDGREPSETFLYLQVILDALLVTGIVHVTSGPESGFASLYILVISEGALLLPLPGGVLIGALVSILYFADLAWGYQESFGWNVALRILLFAVVALLTGLLGDRLRRAGQALGAVASELRQLQLDTGDILANLSTGVITVDGEGRLAYANGAAESLLGVDMQQRMGRPALDELDRIAPGLGGMLQTAMERRQPTSRGRVLAGATSLGVSTAVLPRGHEQRPSATALFQDITELERLEELNVRAERLEAVATLSASLAHEIKNPLASIRSAVEQLSRGGQEPGDRVILERLVVTETDRLSRLLTEFLEYSALRMGERSEIDLRALIRGCLILAKQDPDLQGVEVEANLGDEPIVVVGDADLLHRALFNLVINGAQSAGAEGRVVVSLRSGLTGTPPRGFEGEQPVRIEVEDSGPGISAEQRPRIFDPFFTTKVGGSGLGLAVVHRAVEAHKGATFVGRSAEGGAKFTILLPGINRSLETVAEGVAP